MSRKSIQRELAIDEGRDRYFTGIPCKSGHVCERRVVGNACVECKTEAHARMRARVGEDQWKANQLAANARMRARMGEEAWLKQERARYLDYNRRHPEERRASAKIIMARLYKADPKRFSERSAAHEKRLLETNPTLLRLSQAARRAAYNVRKAGTKSEKGLTAIVRRVWIASEGKCAHCGSTDRLELDHIIAIANGGDNAESNLQFLCKPHNVSKGKRDYQTWLDSRPEPERIAA